MLITTLNASLLHPPANSSPKFTCTRYIQKVLTKSKGSPLNGGYHNFIHSTCWAYFVEGKQVKRVFLLGWGGGSKCGIFPPFVNISYLPLLWLNTTCALLQSVLLFSFLVRSSLESRLQGASPKLPKVPLLMNSSGKSDNQETPNRPTFSHLILPLPISQKISHQAGLAETQPENGPPGIFSGSLICFLGKALSNISAPPLY